MECVIVNGGGDNWIGYVVQIIASAITVAGTIFAVVLTNQKKIESDGKKEAANRTARIVRLAMDLIISIKTADIGTAIANDDYIKHQARDTAIDLRNAVYDASLYLPDKKAAEADELADLCSMASFELFIEESKRSKSVSVYETEIRGISDKLSLYVRELRGINNGQK